VLTKKQVIHIVFSLRTQAVKESTLPHMSFDSTHGKPSEPWRTTRQSLNFYFEG